ncbi:ROK family transcriptional regulator [Rhizobium sp. C4]|uniref:ROK family transcriptional regulator n=1 Tax=Rhizobium sp. C4 TaxID=1349800 RepID=UPI001E288B29|nr:ROK family transcriptional regulator [Rhizobium sp. C4]MCD2175388.1 ROK family transcriptional regulator [Rhizobium sp. C4]
MSNQRAPEPGDGEAARIVIPSGGANQVRVRAYNERLVLSLVRSHEALSKADIARASGLSAQTVSVIMRALEKDGLLVKGEPVRGKVGQPSVPMSLDAEGVFAFGLKIGRRSADMILMDFVGGVRAKLRRIYAYPTPQEILAFVKESMAALEASMTPLQLSRLAGLGVATPFELWNWADNVGAPQGEMDAWRDFDLRAEIQALTQYPVYLQNDATSACGAELMFGRGKAYPDYVYYFIGTFIGGGVVLNSSVFTGRTGTAGAIGPLPVRDEHGKPRQLIDVASIFVLESLLKERGIDVRPLWYSASGWTDWGEPLERWISLSAEALAQAIIAAASIIDFPAAIIDGGFPEWVRTRLVAATRAALLRYDLQGIIVPDIVEGKVGDQARAIGAACLPLFARYLTDQNVLFKELSSAEGD